MAVNSTNGKIIEMMQGTLQIAYLLEYVLAK